MVSLKRHLEVVAATNRRLNWLRLDGVSKERTPPHMNSSCTNIQSLLLTINNFLCSHITKTTVSTQISVL